MKHKIVLYNPQAVFCDMPLALLAIGSNLNPEKYEVVIIDGRIDKQAHKKIIDACEGALCFGALAISRKVKQKYTKLPVVWGGWRPSLFATEILGLPASD